MRLEYYAGLKFCPNGDEFTSDPSCWASKAFTIARVGNSKKYHDVTFYVRQEQETRAVAIPYSEMTHFEEVTWGLEIRLRRWIRERLKK